MPLIRAEFLRPHQLGRTVLIHDPSQVLYLPFDHDDGSKARDRSGYNNHGVVYGATRVAGKIGSALSFDGVDDYVDCGTGSSLDITSSFSIEAWIKTDIVTTNHVIVGKHDGNVKGYILFIVDDKVRVAFDDVAVNVVISSIKLTQNLWYHVVGVFDDSANTLKIYLDGTLDNTQTNITNNPTTHTYNCFIGKLMVGNVWNWDGVIDEVRIYNRALSQAEIRRVMNLRGI